MKNNYHYQWPYFQLESGADGHSVWSPPQGASIKDGKILAEGEALAQILGPELVVDDSGLVLYLEKKHYRYESSQQIISTDSLGAIQCLKRANFPHIQLKGHYHFLLPHGVSYYPDQHCLHFAPYLAQSLLLPNMRLVGHQRLEIALPKSGLDFQNNGNVIFSPELLGYLKNPPPYFLLGDFRYHENGQLEEFLPAEGIEYQEEEDHYQIDPDAFFAMIAATLPSCVTLALTPTQVSFHFHCTVNYHFRKKLVTVFDASVQSVIPERWCISSETGQVTFALPPKASFEFQEGEAHLSFPLEEIISLLPPYLKYDSDNHLFFCKNPQGNFDIFQQPFSKHFKNYPYSHIAIDQSGALRYSVENLDGVSLKKGKVLHFDPFRVEELGLPKRTFQLDPKTFHWNEETSELTFEKEILSPGDNFPRGVEVYYLKDGRIRVPCCNGVQFLSETQQLVLDPALFATLNLHPFSLANEGGLDLQIDETTLVTSQTFVEARQTPLFSPRLALPFTFMKEVLNQEFILIGGDGLGSFNVQHRTYTRSIKSLLEQFSLEYVKLHPAGVEFGLPKTVSFDSSNSCLRGSYQHFPLSWLTFLKWDLQYDSDQKSLILELPFQGKSQYHQERHSLELDFTMLNAMMRVPISFEESEAIFHLPEETWFLESDYALLPSNWIHDPSSLDDHSDLTPPLEEEEGSKMAG